MNMKHFGVENRARCEAPGGFNHALNSWSLSDWMTATLGELGEAANIAKKLNRVRDGIPGNSETPDALRAALADEIADTFIYLDLLAQSAEIDLSEAVRTKFDRTSAKIGYRPQPSPAPEITARAVATLATARDGDTVVVAVVDAQGSIVLHTIGHDPAHLVQVARSLLEQAEDALHERIDAADCNDQGDHPEEQLLSSVLEALVALPAAED